MLLLDLEHSGKLCEDLIIHGSNYGFIGRRTALCCSVSRTRATHTQKRASETARTLTNSIAIRAAAGPRDPASLRRSAITKRPLSHGSVCSVDLFEFINRSYVTTKVSDSASEGCGLAAMHGGQVAAPQPGRAHPPVGVTARKKVGSGF